MKATTERTGPGWYMAGAHVDDCDIKNRVFLVQHETEVVTAHTDNPIITQLMMGNYFSLIIHDNGFPVERLSIIDLGSGQFEYRYYRYSAPVEYRPFQAELTAAPDTTVPEESTTTAAPSTTATDAPTTTTSETSTTSAAPQSTSTSMAPPSSSSSSSTPVTVASGRSFDDACRNLEGVEVYPGVDSWSTSTRFEISISNDCMTRDDNQTWFEIYAFNEETYESMHFDAAGDTRNRVTAHGRLYAGEWTVRLVQSSQVIDQVDDSGSIVISAFASSELELKVNVEQDPDDDWNLCDGSDAAWNGSELTWNCDYNSATLYMVNNPDVQDDVDTTSLAVNPAGQPTAVSLRSGWVPSTLDYRFDGFRSTVSFLLCATNCDVLPDELTLTSNLNQSTFSATVSPDDCSQPAGHLAVVHLKKIGSNLLVTNGRDLRDFVDYVPNNSRQFSVGVREGTDHIAVIEQINGGDQNCRLQGSFGYARWTIVEFTEPVASSAPADTGDTVEPARVGQLDYSRKDSAGAPVLVDDDQSIVVIPTTAIPSYFASSASGITSISARTADGDWTPVSAGLDTVVTIADDATALEIKYTFDDGTESVVTKPLVSNSDVTSSSDGGNSNVLLIVVLILGLILAGAGGIALVRRKN